jgi:hypothetical protein
MGEAITFYVSTPQAAFFITFDCRFAVRNTRAAGAGGGTHSLKQLLFDLGLYLDSARRLEQR